MKILKIISIVVVCLVALYTLAGFFLVPYLITDYLPSLLKKDLNINTTFKEATFNPFTYQLNIKEPALLTEKDDPIFTTKNFDAQLNVMDLFKKSVNLESVGFLEPKVYAIVNKQGQFNFFNLIDQNNTTKTSEETNESSWIFDIKELSIQNGNIIFKDEREEKSFEIELKPINYKANNISTAKDAMSTQTFTTQSETIDDISMDGDMGINPFNAKGKIDIKNLKVEKIWDYSIGDGSYYPKEALADISFKYAVDTTKKGLKLAFDELQISMKNAKVFHKDEKIASLEKLAFDNFKILINLEKDKNFINLDKGDLNVDNVKLISSEKMPLSSEINGLHVQGISFDYDFKNKIKSQIKNLEINGTKLLPSKTIPASGNINALSVQGVTFDSSMNKSIKSQIDNFIINNADINLSEKIAPYSGNFKKLSLNKLDLSVSQDKNGSFLLTTKDIELQNSTLKNINLKKPFLHTNDIVLNSLKLQDNNMSAELLKVDKMDVALSLKPDGAIDIIKGMQSNDANTTEDINTTSKPFAYAFKNIQVNDTNFTFKDETIKKPFIDQFNISTIKATNVSSQKGQDMSLHVKVNNKKMKTLLFEGTVSQKPLHVKGKYEIEHKNLEYFQNYIDEFANIVIKQGGLKSKGDIDITQKEKLFLNINTDIHLNNATINKKDNSKLASWETLDINKLNYNQDKKSVNIKKVLLEKPESELVLNEDGTTNFENLTNNKTDNKNNKKTKKKKTSTFAVAVNDFEVKNGQFNIHDKTLITKKANVSISDINLQAKKYESKQDKAMSFDAKATVNKSGYLSLNGGLYPNNLKKNTDFKLITKGISLPGIESYLKTYLGRGMEKGTISAQISQQIKEGILSGSNNIKLEQMVLGETIQSKKALNLPLEAAILLLRDSNGDVTLNIPVSGNLNDPQFSYGSVIVTAFTNVITGIVTAPFSILGSILGIDGEKLKTVDFEPSSTTLVSSELEKMSQYVKILEQKQKLKLTITGTYAPNIDFMQSKDNNTTKKESSSQSDNSKLIQLAKDRANVIKESLIKSGIDASRIIINKPVGITSTNDNWVKSKIGINQ